MILIPMEGHMNYASRIALLAVMLASGHLTAQSQAGEETASEKALRKEMGLTFQRILARDKIKLYPGARLKDVHLESGEEESAFVFVYQVAATKLAVSKFYEVLAASCMTATVEESEEGELGVRTVNLTLSVSSECPSFPELQKVYENYAGQ